MIYVKTTYVDRFGGGGAAPLFRAELDSRPSGLNLGITTFVPGAKPYILLFKDPSVTVERVVFSMDGLSLVEVANQVLEMEDTLTFEETRTASIGYPFTSEVSKVWMGHDLGNLTVVGGKVTAQRSGTAIVNYKYNSTGQAFRLEGVPQSVNGLTKFDILVNFYGRVGS